VGEAFIIPARSYGARCLSVSWLNLKSKSKLSFGRIDYTSKA